MLGSIEVGKCEGLLDGSLLLGESDGSVVDGEVDGVVVDGHVVGIWVGNSLGPELGYSVGLIVG